MWLRASTASLQTRPIRSGGSRGCDPTGPAGARWALIADIVRGVQPPDVTAQILRELRDLQARLPAGYAITAAGSMEESGKANAALAPIFPIMVVLMLTVIMLQTRSFRMTGLVFATGPLGLIGAVPALLLTAFASTPSLA